jgi:hypothetical protein
MKSKIYVLTALLFFTQAAMAQLNFGIKLGANITKVEGRSFRDEFLYGYHAGGFVNIGLGGKLSIQPEVLFNQYNTRVDSSFSAIYANALDFSNYKDVKLNYLSIPLILNYKMGNVISLQAGPQFGILMDQDKNLLENGKEAFKTGDLSVVGGIQASLAKFRLTGRYFIGLNDINDIDDQNQWKNQGFQLSAGFAF